jgi:hypothetical protein
MPWFGTGSRHAIRLTRVWLEMEGNLDGADSLGGGQNHRHHSIGLDTLRVSGFLTVPPLAPP